MTFTVNIKILIRFDLYRHARVHKWLFLKTVFDILRGIGDDIDMLEGGHRGIVELLLKRYAGINTKVKTIVYCKP